MAYSRIVGAVSISILGGFLVACAGPDGKEGPAGLAGPAGPQGPAGPEGPPGTTPFIDAGVDGATTNSCAQPCHGFGNVVDQWKFSGHYKISAMADDNPTWTGAASCGNCHALDGIERRVAGVVTVADGGVASGVANGHLNFQTATGGAAEAVYAGLGKNAIIHCSTCHAFTPTNDPHVTGKYEPGSAPLRVASGPDDQSLIEKSPADAGVVGQPAGKYKAGNTCVFCHKSRRDVTAFITPANRMSSTRWGPHQGPQADIYSGKGAYHFPGQSYGTSVHTTLANGCVGCHMTPVASNKNVPDHSMIASIAACKTCHTTYTGTSYDIQSGQSTVRAGLFELQAALNARGLLTRSSAAPFVAMSETELRDGAFQLDQPRPQSGVGPDGGVADQVLSATDAGALYNYLLLARGRDFGVHNPTYTKQLLWDSIRQIKGTTPTFMSARASS